MADIPIWAKMGFPSAQAYQTEIQRKQSAGIPLDRPLDATNFMAQYNGMGVNQPNVATIQSNYKGGSGLPSMPSLQAYQPTTFQAPQQKTTSFMELVNQAKQLYAPEYDAARTSAGTQSQQQQGLLAQQLGARGQVRGGLRNEMAGMISGNLQNALATLSTAYQKSLAEYADSKQKEEADRNFRDLQFAYNMWNDAEQLRLTAIQQGNDANLALYDRAVDQAQIQFNRVAMRSSGGSGGGSGGGDGDTPNEYNKNPKVKTAQEYVMDWRKAGWSDARIADGLINVGFDPFPVDSKGKPMNPYVLMIANDKRGYSVTSRTML